MYILRRELLRASSCSVMWRGGTAISASGANAPFAEAAELLYLR
jgi:hypothetical protein